MSTPTSSSRVPSALGWWRRAQGARGSYDVCLAARSAGDTSGEGAGGEGEEQSETTGREEGRIGVGHSAEWRHVSPRVAKAHFVKLAVFLNTLSEAWGLFLCNIILRWGRDLRCFPLTPRFLSPCCCWLPPPPYPLPLPSPSPSATCAALSCAHGMHPHPPRPPSAVSKRARPSSASSSSAGHVSSARSVCVHARKHLLYDTLAVLLPPAQLNPAPTLDRPPPSRLLRLSMWLSVFPSLGFGRGGGKGGRRR